MGKFTEDDAHIDDNMCVIDEEMKAFKSVNSNCNVECLITKIRRHHYELTPDWQREFVWNPKQKSALIESILIGLPIPSIFIFQNQAYPHDVIDGKQRLTTLYSFVNDGFQLTGLLTLRSLNGKLYSELPDTYKEKLETYDININMISSPDQNLKFKMFERLNTGGTALNAQEIRNCVYRGPFNDLVRKLARNETFNDLLNRKSENKRMEDESFVLSYLTFRDAIANGVQIPGRSLKHMLNHFCEVHKNADAATLGQFEEDFKFACRATSKVFGDGTAFRKLEVDENGAIVSKGQNVAIFRIQMMAFSMYRNRILDIQLRSDEIRSCFIELLKDRDFSDLISFATGNFDKNRDAFFAWRDVLVEIMNAPANVQLEISTERVEVSQEMRKLLWSQSETKTCHICGNKILSINDMQVDHLIPVSKGGTNSPNNLAISHSVCNNTKSNYIIVRNND